MKRREGLLCLAELLAVVLFAAGFGSGFLDNFLQYEKPACPDSGPLPDHCYSVPAQRFLGTVAVTLGALG